MFKMISQNGITVFYVITRAQSAKMEKTGDFQSNLMIVTTRILSTIRDLWKITILNCD